MNELICLTSSVIAGIIVGSFMYFLGYKKGYSNVLDWASKRMHETFNH